MEFDWYDIASDPAGWDQSVAQTKQSLFNHSRVLAVHAFQGAQLRGVALRRGGRTIAVLGGLMRETPAGRSFESLCFPVLGPQRSDSLVYDLIGWLHGQGVTQMKFGSFAGGVESYCLGDGFTLTERLEFPWDLNDSAESRRRRLRTSHRRKLNKLDRQALTARRIERNQAWLLTRTRAQWAERKGEKFRLADLVRLYGYHRLLHKHLTRTGIANLYGLYGSSGRLLSVAYMLEFRDLSFYMIGASSPEGYRLSASMKLFWDLARFYSDKGFRYLHLGGVPKGASAEQHEEHGVYRFKQGFGIDPAIRMTLSTHR